MANGSLAATGSLARTMALGDEGKLTQWQALAEGLEQWPTAPWLLPDHWPEQWPWAMA